MLRPFFWIIAAAIATTANVTRIIVTLVVALVVTLGVALIVAEPDPQCGPVAAATLTNFSTFHRALSIR